MQSEGEGGAGQHGCYWTVCFVVNAGLEAEHQPVWGEAGVPPRRNHNENHMNTSFAMKYGGEFSI